MQIPDSAAAGVLSAVHGRYDTVLKFVARHPGAMHGDIIAHLRDTSSETGEQIGGHLTVLIERYRLIGKRLPVFAAEKAKGARYYVTDNFLRSWLSALAGPIAALNFRPIEPLLSDADGQLANTEGGSFEKLVGTLYEERSRKGLGDFPLTQRIDGYWDRNDVEIDLVAVNEQDRRIRFGTCRRNAEKLPAALPNFALC